MDWWIMYTSHDIDSWVPKILQSLFIDSWNVFPLDNVYCIQDISQTNSNVLVKVYNNDWSFDNIEMFSSLQALGPKMYLYHEDVISK